MHEKMALPVKPKPVESNILKYDWLIYGREKIGKTTLAASIPHNIFFCTEPGAKGLPIMEFNHENGGAKNWKVILEGIRLLTSEKHGFQIVTFDTIDNAYDFCSEYVCRKLGISAPGVTVDGKRDYGASWIEIRSEFSNAFRRLKRAGLSVMFISHCKEEQIESYSGEKYSRIFPSMKGQARGIVESLVDFFFYAEYIRLPNGESKRVLICEGDELVWAGAREGIGGSFPRMLPLERVNGFDIIRKAFAGEYKGLDVSRIEPGLTAKKAAKSFIGDASLRALDARLKSKKEK